MISKTTMSALGVLRIALGFVFLWVFIDKMFGLGFSTSVDHAWLAGFSPTSGYLSYGAHGPFAGLFQSLSGNVVVDTLFMGGMLGVGCALVLGVGMRIATISGGTIMALIYLSQFPPAHNPVIDEHIIYILVLIVLFVSHSGDALGFGLWWKKQSLTTMFPWLE
ncbi:hypothetical protein CO180_00210 [candidate division WWE3 bacterium CG_4_9_14_3_um_filter_41_6]|uniref:DoxX family protein n=1 Tax=candidate division WWE3 bacterium CG_4_10_14_0_2_um_filter_41_14 TaxID=1975072 RepID=A0A2M7THK4_UNCKA|nr:MAG: hypothetical protein COY32_04590 [candidate division WWE3 bacterium CG_4_10_14_0_2_um_filter_41_14]PJA39656.1 MAG: hypothetical protein CO180_00210 [candidate division WWE3 bacterium CG_4_9_14_3_um_filter_41_6]